MEGLLPQEVLHQPKAGFAAPLDYWLAHELRQMVDDLLSEQRIRDRGMFSPAAVRKLILAQRSGRSDLSLQIWQLLTLELWCQTFVDRLPHHDAGCPFPGIHQEIATPCGRIL